MTDVQEELLGTELVAAVTAGDPSFTVEDLDGLAAPSGGLAIVRGPLLVDKYIYSIEGSPDGSSDELELEEEADSDQGVVLISPTALNNYAADAKVLQYPYVTERLAWVLLEDQQDEIPVTVGDPFLDRLPTGTREDPEAAETLVLDFVENEYVIRDIVGEAPSGISRGTTNVDGPISVTSTDASSPDVLATLPIEIPTEDHRVLANVSVEVLGGGTGDEISFHLDDGGFDISPPDDDISAAPDGALLGTDEVRAYPYPVMPYLKVAVPTPGLHVLRLTSHLQTAGSAAVANIHLWATVI